MGWKDEVKKAGSKWARETRRAAKYTLAAAGGMVGGAAGARAGYEIGDQFDDRNKNRQSGTDLGKLRRDAVANGFNPLTVLRATGGQGFYKDQVPMGRLSSDAFFDAFDAYDNHKNKNAEIIDPTAVRAVDPKLSESISVNDPHVTQSKVMYRPSVLQEETVTSLLSNGMQITTDDKIKSIIGMTRDRFGKIHYHPWVEWEIDEMITQLAGNAWFEATHWRDKALKSIGKFFTANKTDKISRQQIRDIVNSRKIKNNLHTPILQSQPNYYQKIPAVPIKQQQKIMEELFP